MSTHHLDSLIIPCYNEQETISDVIEGSLSFVDEIIVVNDGSDDDTKSILTKRDDIILLDNATRLGQEKSIERGIEKSKGDIIITMDADLEHDPNDIKKFKNYFLKNNVDVIIGRRLRVPRSGEKKLNEIFEKNVGITDVMNGFRLFRRTVYDEIGFFHKNDFYGLDFLLEAQKKFKIGQIYLSEKPRRHKPRIGSDEVINKKLEEITEYVKRKFSK